MIRALYSAASGMTAQETNVDNIANNLANANTVGFKSRRAQFQDLMYQSMVQPGTASGQQTVVPTGLQLGLGTRAASNEIIFTQGAFTETDNPLDLVIQGNGFFQIQMPNGTLAYTRAGQFQLDKSGNVVTSQGYPLSPQITIPATAQQVTIASDGTVSYTLPNQTAAQTAGQIQLANFPNPAGLEQPGQQPLCAHGCVGRPHRRRARRSGRTRFAAARLHRAIERLHRQRIHQPDSGAARLRIEFQSSPGRRPDVSTGQWPHPMMFLAPFALAGCLALPAGSERVTAADLAPAFPGLESVPPETVLSFAPEPGLERVFHIPELRQNRRAISSGRRFPKKKSAWRGQWRRSNPPTLLAAMQKEMPGAKIADSRIQPATRAARGNRIPPQRTAHQLRGGRDLVRSGALCAQSRIHNLGQGDGDGARFRAWSPSGTSRRGSDWSRKM